MLQMKQFSMGLPPINPPLINSSNPWATTTSDLQQLFDCPHTGAVTTRTSLLHGFEHDDTIHQRTFFDPSNHALQPGHLRGDKVPSTFGASLNTLGYSPIVLSAYLSMIQRVVTDSTLPDEIKRSKPFIISVTGSAQAVRECYRLISMAQGSLENPLCMEINLSCPNIPDKPPPAYSGDSLAEYLKALGEEERDVKDGYRRVRVGIKTPPYTYLDQFKILIDALLASCGNGKQCPIDFITTVNTLGSSLVLADEEGKPAINSANGEGIGGMAGAPLHPLALGNVKTIRSMLDQHEELRAVDVIGIGGVSDNAGFRRMQAVGAKVVGVGTAFGREGMQVFSHILEDVK